MNWLRGLAFVCAFLGAAGYVEKIEREKMARYQQRYQEKQQMKQAWSELERKACFMTNCKKTLGMK